MKAMILAAGRGERMRPLTDNTPKPLLLINGQPIIVYTIKQLVSAGITDLIINHAYLGEQIEQYLGDGLQYGATIQYSREGDTALETAGGIINALPLLGDEVFLVVNGDIATDFPFESLLKQKINLAHIVLVNNPSHHLDGDFALNMDTGLVSNKGTKKLTFSGIGLYAPELFRFHPKGQYKLAPLLRAAISNQQVSGQYFNGLWLDIGTPERLIELDTLFKTL